MTLRRLLLASAFAFALAPLSAAAQATRGSTPVPPGVNPNVPVGPAGTPIRGGAVRPTHDTMGGDTYISTRSVSGEVREVNLEEGYILVVIPKKGTGRFYVGDKTRLRADKETPLGDKKRLTLEDFRKGQTVKVTFWPNNFEATEVRVRQPKS